MVIRYAYAYIEMESIVCLENKIIAKQIWAQTPNRFNGKENQSRNQNQNQKPKSKSDFIQLTESE